jgi:hypothetical protein
MISDILSDATQHIREFLDDPTYSRMYAGKLRVEIEQVVAAMESLRETLDQPPTRPPPKHDRCRG